jgi:hypothetical protein
MGGNRSFRIESKRFDLVLGEKGPNHVKFTEIGKHHRCDIFTGKEGAIWLGRCVEENITREKEQAFIRTRGEYNKTYVIRRFGNIHGRYVEVTECGRGVSRGRIIIPEGQNQSGWRGFVKELKLLLSPREEGVAGDVARPVAGVASGKMGQTTYAGAVGKGASTKSGKEKEQMVAQSVPVKETKRRDDTLQKSVPQLPPPLPAKSKTHVPLRFFPNENPISQKRTFGYGLKINVNERGVRRVSRDFKEDVGLPREKWVPKVTAVKPKELGQNTKAQVSLVLSGLGSSTYESGEASGSLCGPCQGPEDSMGLGSDLTLESSDQPEYALEPTDQPDHSNRVFYQPDKVKPAQADVPLPCELALMPEKRFRLDPRYGATMNGMTWVLHVADEGRCVIPEYFISRWPPVSDFYTGFVSRICHVQGFGLGFSQELRGSRGYESKAAVVDLDGFDGFDTVTSTELVLWRDNDSIGTEPLAMVAPHVEDHDMETRETPRVGFYQNPPSDWVLSQMKEFGKCVGASYEGYEDEIIALLQKIEARRPPQKQKVPSQKGGTQSANRGQRELRGLQSSVNYDVRRSVGCRNNRERALILSS